MTVKTVKNCSLKTEYWKIDYIEDITMSKPRIKTSKDLMLSNKSKNFVETQESFKVWSLINWMKRIKLNETDSYKLTG